VDFLGTSKFLARNCVSFNGNKKMARRTSGLPESCDLSNFFTQLSKSTQVLSFSFFQIESNNSKILLLLQ
jgi:hypothetical protein